MKRPLEEPSLELEMKIPDISVRVPLPELPRVMSVDDDGVETLVASLTPLDVQNAANKRVFRAHEWGKNVLKDPTEPVDPLEHLDEDERQIVQYISYAKSEMAILGQFANALADGKHLQLDYVPPNLPLEHEERAFRATRFSLRKSALGKAAASLKDAAARLREAVPQDKAYYEELRLLRKKWTLQIAGGAKFHAVLSAVCGAQYGIPSQDSSVPIGRSLRSGSVETVVPALLRPRLCVNRSSAWACEAKEGATATGVQQVHAMLMELQRCARSNVLNALLRNSFASATKLTFASVRDEGNAVVANLMVRASSVETVSFSLGQPELVTQSSLVELFLGFLLSQQLRHKLSGLPLVFGDMNEFTSAFCSSCLAWTLQLQGHAVCRKEADAVFLEACRCNLGLSFVWGGCDLLIRPDGSCNVVSNVFFKRNKKSVVVSVTDAGSKWLVNFSAHYGLAEVVKCVLETLK